MKNYFRTVSGIAAGVLGILLLAGPACGDFQLRIDGGTLREIGGTGSGSYEIDAFIEQTPANTPATIQSVLLNLSIAPANGYSLNDISGVKFDGLRNPDATVLFPNPTVRSQFFGPLSMKGSLVSSNPIATPSTTRTAFTVLFSTSRGTASDVEIKFEQIGNFYEVDRDNEGIVHDFVGLFSSPPITVVKVPEPSTYLLATLALGGMGLGRRFSKSNKRRSDKKLG